jgi:hypothetical protein
MSSLENLTDERMREILADAAGKELPLIVTVRRRNRWVTFRSNFLATHESILWIAPPVTTEGDAPLKHEQAEKAGLTFEYSHQKHIVGAVIEGPEEYTDEEGNSGKALRLQCSSPMRRVQRRLHIRFDPPAEWQLRARFWLGGRNAQPGEANVESPVWSGKVIDMSRGGIMVRADRQAGLFIDGGDIVGIELDFTADGKIVYLDAQRRNCQEDGEMVLLGFQFVDVDRTEYARRAVELIGQKLAEAGVE